MSLFLHRLSGAASMLLEEWFLHSLDEEEIDSTGDFSKDSAPADSLSNESLAGEFEEVRGGLVCVSESLILCYPMRLFVKVYGRRLLILLQLQSCFICAM